MLCCPHPGSVDSSKQTRRSPGAKDLLAKYHEAGIKCFLRKVMSLNGASPRTVNDSEPILTTRIQYFLSGGISPVKFFKICRKLRVI